MTIGFYYLAILLSLCVTLPISARAGLNITLSDLVAFPTAACLALEALRSRRARTSLHEVYAANRWVFWYVAWAGLAGAVGLTRSDEALKAFKDLVPAFVLYVLVALHVDRPSRFWALVTTTLAGAALHIGLAILQSTLGAPYLAPTSPGLDAKLDIAGHALTNIPVGLFAHPNALAVFAIPFVLFGIAAVWIARADARWAIIALLAPALFVFERTQAKGAYIFVALGAMLLALPRRSDRIRLVAGITLAVAVTAGVVWYAVSQFLAGAEGYGTLLSRVELWNRAVDVISTDHVTQIVGSGYTAFASADILSFEYPSAHNAWLDQVLSFGLPGLVFYAGCFIGALRILAREIPRMTGAARGVLVATFASIAALLGEYFFEPVDRGNQFVAELFLLFVLALVVPRALRAREPAEPVRGAR